MARANTVRIDRGTVEDVLDELLTPSGEPVVVERVIRELRAAIRAADDELEGERARAWAAPRAARSPDGR